MKKTTFFALLAYACAGMASGVPLVGCGDGGEGGSDGSGGNGASVEDACKSLASALCGQIETCAPFFLNLSYPNKATCEERVLPTCLAAPDLDGNTITASDIEACAADYAAQSCDSALSETPAACRLKGDKADGESCVTNTQCKGGLCQLGSEGSCGLCTAPLAAGATCGNSNAECDTGLFCSSDGKCKQRAAKGDDCGNDFPCSGGLSCNGGKCGAPGSEGAGCGGDNGSCDTFKEGLICGASSTCEKILVAKVGAKCGFDMVTGKITVCEADARCDDTETCIPRLNEGEACTFDPATGEGSDSCVSGLSCVDSECTTAYPDCN